MGNIEQMIVRLKIGHIAKVCRSQYIKVTQETNLIKERGNELIDEDSTDENFNNDYVSLWEKQEPCEIDVLINSA